MPVVPTPNPAQTVNKNSLRAYFIPKPYQWNKDQSNTVPKWIAPGQKIQFFSKFNTNEPTLINGIIPQNIFDISDYDIDETTVDYNNPSIIPIRIGKTDSDCLWNDIFNKVDIESNKCDNLPANSYDEQEVLMSWQGSCPSLPGQTFEPSLLYKYWDYHTRHQVSVAIDGKCNKTCLYSNSNSDSDSDCDDCVTYFPNTTFGHHDDVPVC